MKARAREDKRYTEVSKDREGEKDMSYVVIDYAQLEDTITDTKFNETESEELGTAAEVMVTESETQQIYKQILLVEGNRTTATSITFLMKYTCLDDERIMRNFVRSIDELGDRRIDLKTHGETVLVACQEVVTRAGVLILAFLVFCCNRSQDFVASAGADEYNQVSFCQFTFISGATTTGTARVSKDLPSQAGSTKRTYIPL